MEPMLVKVTEMPPVDLTPPKEQVSQVWHKVMKEQKKAEELERKAEKLAQDADEVRQTAQESLEHLLVPLRAQRKSLLETQASKAKTVAELSARLEKAQSALDKATTKLERFDADVEDMGIPVVLLGAKKYRKQAVPNSGIRTTIKPEMIGAFEPVIVTGPRRHGDKDSRCSIEVSSNGEHYRARRVDSNEESGYIESRRLSDVTTSPGWLETKDVAYAVLTYLGRTEEFPSLQPISDPSKIEVNGYSISA